MMTNRALRVSARLSAALALRWRWRSSCHALTVAFVMIAVFDAPMFAGSNGRSAGSLLRTKAAQKDASVVFRRLWGFFLAPVASDEQHRAGCRQSRFDGRNGNDGCFAAIDAPVIAVRTQVKKGVPLTARVAAASRVRVLSLVPIR